MSGGAGGAAAGIAMGTATMDSATQLYGQMQANAHNRMEATNQRKWNEKMWRYQNAYNTPEEQMKRFEEAGLNPHLIYGKGTNGNAADVRGYDRAQIESVTKGFQGFSNALANYQTIAATDNVQAQTQVATQEAANKAVEGQLKTIDVAQKKFDLGLSKQLRDASVIAGEANAYKSIQTARQSAEEYRRSKVEADIAVNTKDPRIKEAKARLDKILAEKDSVQIENELQKLEYDLNKKGVQKADNVIFRLLMRNPNSRWLLDKILGKKYYPEQNQ